MSVSVAVAKGEGWKGEEEGEEGEGKGNTSLYTCMGFFIMFRCVYGQGIYKSDKHANIRTFTDASD